MYPMILVAHVDKSASVDDHVLRLRDELSRFEAVSGFWMRWHKVGDLLGLARVADVVDAQAGVEVSQIGDVVAVFEACLVVWMMVVVRTEAAGFLVEIF